MDGCFGLAARFVSFVVVAVLLNGCYCLNESQDRSDVGGYFSGCWDELSKNYERNR